MTNAENRTYSTPDEVKGVVRLKDALNTKTYKQNAGSEGSTKHKKKIIPYSITSQPKFH